MFTNKKPQFLLSALALAASSATAQSDGLILKQDSLRDNLLTQDKLTTFTPEFRGTHFIAIDSQGSIISGSQVHSAQPQINAPDSTKYITFDVINNDGIKATYYGTPSLDFNGWYGHWVDVTEQSGDFELTIGDGTVPNRACQLADEKVDISAFEVATTSHGSINHLNDGVVVYSYNHVWFSKENQESVYVTLSQAEAVSKIALAQGYNHTTTWVTTSWKLYGSNDQQVWTPIGSGDKPDFPAMSEYCLDSTAHYQYYRLDVSNDLGNYLSLGELELYK
ncbi:hypothetical protein CWB99_11630 [Pseudoalteromonas rubra]|uniref:F5/8 type C domain-containing protein n=1 Tax=Pseudoalteromonas rubra TaxID=43658 RepID=A0A5S3WNL8_9GAMM|nr:hypothetical protein [Pseudoalteromonas rubra]TMP28557.1 hypothetical protein CWB99_11630 [Pseudoalteromonas rubra]TMP30524.1 hypothetical protein CWC00_16750 [Pseudoalteromonas rubra]